MNHFLPRSAYHFLRLRNARTSPSIRSARPSARTTLPTGRFLLGNPKGLHSVPQAVYKTSLPSCSLNAASLASLRSEVNKDLSRASVVRVTVSHGVPEVRCMDFTSRSRFTYK